VGQSSLELEIEYAWWQRCAPLLREMSRSPLHERSPLLRLSWVARGGAELMEFDGGGGSRSIGHNDHERLREGVARSSSGISIGALPRRRRTFSLKAPKKSPAAHCVREKLLAQSRRGKVSAIFLFSLHTTRASRCHTYCLLLLRASPAAGPLHFPPYIFM
jgi:hypothetical protein